MKYIQYIICVTLYAYQYMHHSLQYMNTIHIHCNSNNCGRD